jgi:Raf kinase inhibitor-like YbhB/YbcL family protein
VATRSLVLIVEDADAPTPVPLVHALLFDIPPDTRHIAEGAIGGPAGTESGETGRNSYLRSNWLPPDPPSGHGLHHYAFQLFALNTPIDLTGHPGRSALMEAMTGHVVAAGMLTATYERE